MLFRSVQGDASEKEGENGDSPSDDDSKDTKGEDGQEDGDPEDGEDSKKPSYIVDPETGELVDPVSGAKAEMDYGTDGDNDSLPVSVGAENGDAGNDNGNAQH